MSKDEKFDGLFMTAIQGSQGIENFYTNLFSFMRRKTDFFTYQDKSRDIIISALDEQLKIYNEDKQREAALKAKQEQERKKREAEEAAKRMQGESSATVEEVTEEEAERIMKEEAKKKEKRDAEESEVKVESNEAEENKDDNDKEKSDKQIPNSSNGGETEKYRWGQALDELTLYVWLPDNVTSKQLDVQIKSKRLKVGLKGQPPIIDGELHKKINSEDSLWTLESDGPKRTLQLTFAKIDTMSWWSCVIEGDPKIDTQKVEPENSRLSDLDSETRSTVEKMMFDQQQKQKGLPTSEELEKRNKLDAFMKAHPEMDFSKAKFC